MKYPKEIGPQSQTEMYAWLFGMLGGVYNQLAQYEADERRREEEAMREELIKQRERFTTAVSEREMEALREERERSHRQERARVERAARETAAAAHRHVEECEREGGA